MLLLLLRLRSDLAFTKFKKFKNIHWLEFISSGRVSTAVDDWPTAMAMAAARNTKFDRDYFRYEDFFCSFTQFLIKVHSNQQRKNREIPKTQHSGSFDNLAADLSVHFSFDRSTFFRVQRDNSIDVRHNSRIEFFEDNGRALRGT